jgi:hypothetical protein
MSIYRIYCVTCDQPIRDSVDSPTGFVHDHDMDIPNMPPKRVNWCHWPSPCPKCGVRGQNLSCDGHVWYPPAEPGKSFDYAMGKLDGLTEAKATMEPIYEKEIVKAEARGLERGAMHFPVCDKNGALDHCAGCDKQFTKGIPEWIEHIRALIPGEPAPEKTKGK